MEIAPGRYARVNGGALKGRSCSPVSSPAAILKAMPETPFWTQDSLEDIVSSRSKIMGAGVWAAARPDDRPVISFAGGLPDVPSLPDDELLRATRAVLDTERREALQYGGTFGPQPLREAIAERSSGIEEIPLTAEHVTVTSGAAHGIGIASEVLIDPGDTVLVESPTFPGSLRTFVSFGAQIEALPMDDEGLLVGPTEEALKRLADEGRRVKLLYLIPTHQNPVGSTLPLARREQLLDLAREHRVLIMEDDAYGELWFGDEPPPPSLFSLSGGELAIKVASFSKIIATGLRLGWNLAPPTLITRMAALRYDMGSSPYLGRTVAEMIRNGDLDRHVERLRAIYRRKLDRLCEAIDEHCGDYVTYQRPGGGFFVWLGLHQGLSAIEVQRVANEKGVLIGAGPHFFADGNATQHLRLAFSYTPVEEIEEGAHRLGEALREVAASSPVK
ncbi:MAG: PLP-dependent aminotransferase family protein [Dehalococcoidia bacterium]|nr:PLP-dependent aminotransferase family protein [Dehalococcoidia bacterium]